MLPVDEQLRHKNLVRLHPIPDLVLVFCAHEDVPLFVLDQQVPQYLLHQDTALVCGPDDAHGRCVDYHFARVFFFVALWEMKILG